MEEKYTKKIKECLSKVREETGDRILSEWEKNIFPYNGEVKEYLQQVYRDCR